MNLIQNQSLRSLNTFGIDVKARYFSGFDSVDALEEILEKKDQTESKDILILGGGSNILFTRDYDGWVLKNEITGIEELHEDNSYVYVRAGAGVIWHEFVQYCMQRNWAGLENLSLIPGSVGAAPIQNIGAYGVELRDCFLDLEAFHLEERKRYTFTHSDCRFGYRNSVFKNEYKGLFSILSVTFRLRKQPIFHTSYGAIEEELNKMGVKDLSIQAISEAVIRIRQSKLPDPQQVGNAGSFFKNPEISIDEFTRLKEKFPDIVGYPVSGDSVKLAAGWLIEKCGWKGYRKGDAACHDKQALVLVNYGKATGEEIFNLSENILKSVFEQFSVTLEREVNIL